MSREKLLKTLCKEVKSLDKNTKWLEESYNECKNYKLTKLEDLSKNQLVNLEALSSRFGRTVDILIYKVLRNLDIYELENVDNKLDILIRAEKRGFVDDYEVLIEMKDLRNKLVHEYIDFIIDTFKLVLEYTPTLIEIVRKTTNYINQRYC